MSSDSASTPKYEGWCAFDKSSIEGNFKWSEYEPKKWSEDDVEIRIQYCGMCGSDHHAAGGGWADLARAGMYPQVVGHEIVGEIVRVGKDVGDKFKVGDIAGVGASCDSCHECDWCKKGREQYCAKGMVGTYTSKYKRDTPAKGDKTYGGYANFWRGPAHHTILIPKEVDPADAAPMLCGGVTVYSPLSQYGAGTTAKDVGIVGVGGLGHFGVLFASAMGANVTAISHGKSKVEDAKKMGASKVLISGDDPAAAFKGHERTLDLIVATTSDPEMPLAAYISLIRPGGYFVLVGAAEAESIPRISAFAFLGSNVHFTGSAIGSPTTTIPEMLQFAVKHNIKPWTNRFPMDQINTVMPDFVKNGAKYRNVMVNVHNGGKVEAAREGKL